MEKTVSKSLKQTAEYAVDSNSTTRRGDRATMLLDSRIHSLQRRANSLPKNMERWILYAEDVGRLEKNYSQLNALDLFMNRVIKHLEQATSELSRLAQLTPSNMTDTLHQIQVVEDGIFKAHYIWCYFRSKLEQRFIPQFARALLVADLVSYDCYSTVMHKATTLGIQHTIGLRDYPLTYLLEDYSLPVTRPRTVKLSKLDYRMLPIPIIGIPLDHIANLWELLSLHHEVSHNLDIDLNEPSQELGLCLAQKMGANGTPQQRISVWQCWISEIFADFLGIILAGPPFVSCLAGFMTLPVKSVSSLVLNEPHPPPYLRILLNVEFIQNIALGNDAQEYIDNLLIQWKGVYGDLPDDMNVYVDDFSIVIETILSTKLKVFVDESSKQHTLHEFIGFSEEDFKNQLTACNNFLSCSSIIPDIPIRHIIGAAYMAVEKKSHDDHFAGKILEQIIIAIEAKAPKGKLSLRTKQSKQHLEKLAESYFYSNRNLTGGLYDQAIR
jgi:hypothetical protein